MLLRRDFLQVGIATAALYGSSGFGNFSKLAAQQKINQDDLLEFDTYGNVSLIHITDIHGQLKPIYFREPEINLGVLAGTGGTARLTRLIGKSKALEMMVTGELMSFEDALDCNLINHLWEGDADDFRRDVLDWASQFTLPNKATKAVGNIKRSCQTGPEIPFEYHLALERELQAALFGSSDAKEGIAAYVEKRVPSFEGH